MASSHTLGVFIAALAVLFLCSSHTDAASEPSNVNHCGDHHVICPSEPNSHRTCTDGQCGFECKAGFTLYNNICVAIESPQLPPCQSVSLPPPGVFPSPPPPPFANPSPPPPPCAPAVP